MTFYSAEENEETMSRLGVNQQVTQLERGKFQADMVTRSIEQVGSFLSQAKMLPITNYWCSRQDQEQILLDLN